MAEPVSPSATVGVGSLVTWQSASYRLVAGPQQAKDGDASVEVWLAVECGRSGHERKGSVSKLHAIPCAELAHSANVGVSKAETKGGVNEAQERGCSGESVGGDQHHSTYTAGTESQQRAAVVRARGVPARAVQGSGKGGTSAAGLPATRAIASCANSRLTRTLGCSPTFALTLIALLTLLSAIFD